MAFTLDPQAALLKPIRMGEVVASNRILMAPMTRSRAQGDGTPSEFAPVYYGQRASAGLIISEATAISQAGNGAYMNTPGIYTDRHQHKWAEIAETVHSEGSKMFLQIWHVGRLGHPAVSGGFEPVAPSAVAAQMTTHTPSGKVPLVIPRELRIDEIAEIVDDFRAAARRAIDAGLDGVEIHGANGYLLHQFSSDVINQRTDIYGGSPENRARLTAEVVEAVAAEVGPTRVGVRISPGMSAGDMHENDTVSTYAALLERIDPLGLAYLHVVIDPGAVELRAMGAMWSNNLVLNSSTETETEFCVLEGLVESGAVNAVALGRKFLANPDLIDRLLLGAELNEANAATFYSPGKEGYIDYPSLSAGR
ncbi:oxidoreductase [Mycobacteroides abscessus]|uniref:oxidoreductase n=1 Tax=Mycobacteroides abscessus TaxID=36809 RepID=UPI0009298BE9|nr:alkene reductase [Mycobacteroides abscessus]SHU29947.1 Probable NADH-dependent flavin oxidoreductase [Mycobacteroides abscessus subsp. abscessus]